MQTSCTTEASPSLGWYASWLVVGSVQLCKVAGRPHGVSVGRVTAEKLTSVPTIRSPPYRWHCGLMSGATASASTSASWLLTRTYATSSDNLHQGESSQLGASRLPVCEAGHQRSMGLAAGSGLDMWLHKATRLHQQSNATQADG